MTATATLPSLSATDEPIVQALPGMEQGALMPELTLDGLARVLATVEANPFIPHSPTPQQALFLSLDCREAFYGGAAGGGKTDALLMGALQYVECSDYAALILMRSYADLVKPDAPIPRSHEWLGGTGARYNSQQHSWHFPSSARLDFGYLQRADDRFNYKTAQYQFIGWEELTNFPEIAYRYLFSRQRRLAGSVIPLRVRSGSNPDGAGFEWVKQRFIIEGAAEERPFVPSRVDDNPHIDREEYKAQLEELDPISRERLLRGDWSIIPTGKMFRREWYEIVPSPPAPDAIVASVRFWDMASTEVKDGEDPDWTVGHRMSLSRDGFYYMHDVVADRTSPGGNAKLLRQTAELDGPNVMVFIEQEPGSSGKLAVSHFATHTLAGFSVLGIPATGSKVQRATPLSVASEQGIVKIVRGRWVSAFFDQAVVFGTSDVLHDDHIDAAAGAFNELRKRAAVSFGRI